MKKIFMLACACLLIAACNSNKKRVQTILLLLPTPKSPICIMQKTHWTTMGLTPNIPCCRLPGINITPYAKQG